MTELSEFTQWFNPKFAALLKEKVTTFTAYSTMVEVDVVAGYILKLGEGGKRFRPFLTQVAYQAQGGTKDIFPVLAAIELLHLFALVHDDVMDEALSRHTIATAQEYYKGLYKNSRLSESLAILVGDLLFAWSIELLNSELIPSRAQAEYRTLVTEVIHGQMMDTLCTVLAPQSLDLIEKKIELKTAHYSFYRPLMIGALLQKEDSTFEKFLKGYGQALGMAFQIQDDIFDVSKNNMTGKTSFSDLRAGQQTILSWYMFEKAQHADRELFAQYFGVTDSTETDLALVQEVLESSGGLKFAINRAQYYFEKALKTVEEYFGREDTVWQRIVVLVQERNK